MKPIPIKTVAPNAAASLFLGIASVLFQCFFLGMILGIVGLVLSNRGLKTCRMDPMAYKGQEVLVAGKALSIIGIVISAFWVLYLILDTICVLIWGVGLFVWIGGFDYFASLGKDIGETLYY